MSEEEIPEKDNAGAVEALAVFCDKYEPVSDSNPFTDFFTSREIQSLISVHTGYYFELMELHNMLKNMSYTYKLEQSEFIWECSKVVNE